MRFHAHDGGAVASCESPFTAAALDDGEHTLEVRAADPAGNADPTPASRTFIVDTEAPQTTLTGGPDGPTGDSAPTFDLAADEPGSSFECRVDDGPFAPCGSPHTTAALPDGEHTFEARAVDPAGNADPDPATRTFTVDTDASQTAIAAGPAGVTSDDTPTFELTSDGGARFECSIDGGAFAAHAARPAPRPGRDHAPGRLRALQGRRARAPAAKRIVPGHGACARGGADRSGSRCVRPRRSGSFRVTVRAPSGVRAATFRARTQVRRTPGSRRESATFSLPTPVDLR